MTSSAQKMNIHARLGASKIAPFQLMAPVACFIHGNAFELPSEAHEIKMAEFVVQILEVVDVFISTSRGSKKKLNRKIGGELLELNSAVVKKQMLPAERAYKYHLVQPTCMLSWCVVGWNKSILWKLKRKPNGSAPWTVKLRKDLPFKVYEYIKAASLVEQGGRFLIKSTKHVEEIKFNIFDLRKFLGIGE